MKPWKLRYEVGDAKEGEVRELEGDDFGSDGGVEEGGEGLEEVRVGVRI